MDDANGLINRLQNLKDSTPDYLSLYLSYKMYDGIRNLLLNSLEKCLPTLKAEPDAEPPTQERSVTNAINLHQQGINQAADGILTQAKRIHSIRPNHPNSTSSKMAQARTS